jgi:hypothetical protein
MSDTITQSRLSMRLDVYLRDYTGKKVTKDTRYRKEWDHVWRLADVARLQNTLTPELVDDVRVALQKL